MSHTTIQSAKEGTSLGSNEALEARLREDPQDGASWSVYGDWLQEQGDPRGMIVRLEQQVARTGEQDRQALTARIQELRSELKPPFSLRLPKQARLTWSGGFVVGLVLPLDDTTKPLLERILASRDARLLRSLTLSRTVEAGTGDEDMDFEEGDEVPPPEPTEAEPAKAVLALDLRALRVLSFAYSVLGPDAARALAEASTVGPLLALDLRYCWIADAGLAHLATSPILARTRALWLQRNGIGLQGLRALAASPHTGELRRLDLRYNSLGVEGARVLAESPLLRTLETLQIHRTDLGGTEGARALAESPHLPPHLKRFFRAL